MGPHLHARIHGDALRTLIFSPSKCTYARGRACHGWSPRSQQCLRPVQAEIRAADLRNVFAKLCRVHPASQARVPPASHCPIVTTGSDTATVLAPET